MVADTFTVVWKRRQSCPADSTEWPAWTVGIAKNKIRKELDRVHRKHHDNRFVSEMPAKSIRVTIPDVADRVAEAALGRWIWNQLRAEDKQLANYAFVQGVSHTHAAGALGISVTNYTTRVTRLRQRIAILLSLGARTPRARDGQRCAVKPRGPCRRDSARLRRTVADT